MGNYLWTGASNNDWNNTSNWSGSGSSGLPSYDDDAIFDSTGINRSITSTTTKLAKNVRFNFPGAAYIIGGTPDLSLAADQAITNNSSFNQTFTCNISNQGGLLRFITANSDITINRLLYPITVQKSGPNKLICTGGNLEVSSQMNILEGTVTFSPVNNVFGNYNFNDGTRLEVLNSSINSNVIISGNLVLGNSGIIPTSCRIKLFQPINNVRSYISAPFINILSGNLQIVVEEPLSNNFVHRLFISQSPSYNFNNVSISTNIAAYSGLTFSLNNSMWISTIGTNNQSFLIDPTIGNLYVLPFTSNITMTSSLNPALKGQDILFSAQVTSPTNWTITGNVTFTDNGNPIGTVDIVNGFANIISNTLSSGGHDIIAIYNGNEYHLPATSTNIKQVITATEKTISNISDWTQYVGNTSVQDYILLDDLFFDSSFPGKLSLQNDSIFNGGSNTIYLKNINNFSGLFNLYNTILSGGIQNLTVVMLNVNLNDNCGFLVEGSTISQFNGTIQNVKMIANQSIMGNNCGSLIGSNGNNIIFRKSYAKGHIMGRNSGGLAGNNCSNVSIYNSYVIGQIDTVSGALIGNNNIVQNARHSYQAGIPNNNLLLSGSIINNRLNVYQANIIVL